MKKITLLFVFALGCATAFAQKTWNKKLPAGSPNARVLSDARFDNGHFLITAGSKIVELDEYGTATGFAAGLNNHSYSTFVKKKLNPQTDKPFFVLCSRPPSTSNHYVVIHKSGEGSEVAGSVVDMIGSNSNGGPAIVEINANTFWLIGREFVHQISVSDQAVVTVDWEKPLALPVQNVPNAAILHNGHVYAATNLGILLALNLDGELVWSKDFQGDYAFRGMAPVANGFLTCGTTDVGACVTKFDFNGDLVWEATPGDEVYNALAVNTDGSIVATGRTVAGDMTLLKTDEVGGVLWKKTYQKGQGGKVLSLPDGGYFFVGHGTPSPSVYAIKTNALGESPQPEEHLLIRDRNINNNGVSLTQIPSSTLFFDGSDSGLHIPADSATSPVFAHSPWIAGNDLAGNLHTSASTYGEGFNRSDYRLGLTNSPVEDFNRLWAITREEIALARRDFGEDGDLDALPLFDLLTWPAKGNPHFRQNLDFTPVSTNLDSLPAPFVDVNADGIYNVFDGDYPKIKGERMLWWAITDQAGHFETNGQPLSVDILLSVFTYDCPQNGDIQQSIFIDYEVINRSGEDYTSTYMGFFADPDLGCSDDDYIGTMSDANTYYIYNQDAVDGQPGSTCAGGVATYGANVPVESVTMLDKSMDHAIYFNREGSPETPTTPTEYYFYLKGLMCAGQLPTVGGNGCNPGSTNFTNYVFPDNPADPQGWSMCTANLPFSDRRIVNSHGPFTFAAGDTFSTRLAFTFHPDVPHPCPDVAILVKPAVLQIQQWHDDGTLDAPLDLGGVLLLAPGQSLVLNAAQPSPAASYAWSTGENTPSITVNQTGEYTVTVTRASGCAYTETVLVKSASGTHNPGLSPAWQLLPNPAQDMLKIVFENTETNSFALLRNAQGQTVATKNSMGSGLEISVANLPVGFYWVELWRDGQFWGSRKVAVAR